MGFEFCDRCEVIGGCCASTRNEYTWISDRSFPSHTCAYHRYDLPTARVLAGICHTSADPEWDASRVFGLVESYRPK